MTEDTGNVDLIQPPGVRDRATDRRQRGIYPVLTEAMEEEWCPQLSPDSTWLRSTR